MRSDREEPADETFRRQRELYETVLSAQSDLGEGVVVADGAHIIYANAAFGQILGYTVDEILALPSPWSLTAPEERARLGERLRQRIAGEAVPTHYETQFLHRDGHPVDVELAVKSVRPGETNLVVVIVRDVTEHNRMNQTLRERAQRLSSIYNTVADVIFHLAVEPDGGYRFASVNPAFSRVTGLAYDQVVGKLVDEIIPEPSLSLVLERYREAIRERKIVRWEETSDYPTGQLTGEVSVAPSFDAAGNCTHLVGAVHDVTERKRFEAELEVLLAREQAAREEVEHLNAELERRVADRTAQLDATNKELEAFSYSVAHDLRAPLRAMDGFSRLVVEEYAPHLPADAQRYLGLIRDSAQHMGQLIDDLLTFARLARQPLSLERVDTTRVVRQVVAQLEREHGSHVAAIKVQDLPSCTADPSLLRQVFANLLSNALKFSRKRADPRVEVAFQTNGGEPIYLVRDNGVGFDMRYADKLFGVFQRLHRAEEYEGTGVGLAIVQRIIHRHGGRVWAEAELDKGATFYFTLGGTGDGEWPGGDSTR